MDYMLDFAYKLLWLPLLVVGVLLAVLEAYVYQLLHYWNPFILISLTLPFVFAACLGAIGATIVGKSKVENKALTLLIGVAIGLAGIGSKFWIQYEVAISHAATELHDDSEYQGMALTALKNEIRSQITFWEYLSERAESGMAISRRGRGLPIGGVVMYVLWGLEVLIVVFCTTLITVEESCGSPENLSLRGY